MPNKNKSFLSFLDQLASELETENEKRKAYKKVEKSPLKANKKKAKPKSIFSYLNDMAENMEKDFGEDSKKPDIEAQRRLKNKLRTKHNDKYKKSTYLQKEIDNLAKDSLEEIRSTKDSRGSIKAKSMEGDRAAFERLKEAEKKEKAENRREKLAKMQNRQRLKDAIVMAEILGPPVSKRR